MSPNLYDLLDVDESASREQIRAAWKAVTEDLDPTDRRFRAYNDAAAVLLDEDKRAAYDAELAAAGTVDAPAEEPSDVSAAVPGDRPDVAEQEDVAPAPALRGSAGTAGPVTDVVTTDTTTTDTTASDTSATDTTATDTTATGTTPASGAGPATLDRPPRWALLAALAVGAVSVLLLLVTALLPGTTGGASPKERAELAAEGAKSAEAAVMELVPVVLAYDYRTLDADIDRATSYLTDEFAAERSEFFDQPVVVDGEPVVVDGEELTFREQVVSEKLQVSAAVSRTGVTRISENGEVATVVAYIDQESQKGKAEPQPLRMWATLRLERDGERWLLDDICTEQDCS